MEKRVVSLVLFILGLLFIINSDVDITGAVIGVSIPSNFNFVVGFGLLFVSGILFVGNKEEKRLNKLELMLSQTESPREKIKLIEKGHIQGTINAVETADRMNNVLNHNMQGMTYKNEVSLTISDGINSYPLTLSKKDEDLAYALRSRIRANNPIYKKNCEMHVNRFEASKHHKQGLRE